jgi:hypothetical protein
MSSNLAKVLSATAKKLHERNDHVLARRVGRLSKRITRAYPGMSDEDRNKPFWEAIAKELEAQLRYFGPTHGEMSVITDSGHIYMIFLDVRGEKDNRKYLYCDVRLEDSQRSEFWAENESNIANQVKDQIRKFAAMKPPYDDDGFANDET